MSISPIISKVLEHCILNRYGIFLGSSDNQFGFKKSIGCAHAVHVLRSVVDYYVSFGSTVNICALDLSKAFDKMNHCCEVLPSYLFPPTKSQLVAAYL